MSADTFLVIEPGLLTTVQDLGRYGYQRFGVPVSGAMDGFALRAANLLVGNDEGSAGLEMTVLGPRIRFLRDTCITLTGADLSPTLDGGELPGWQAVQVSRGSVLSFKGPQDGMRAYLAVAGGIDVPVVMGSRSTYLKSGIGGYRGRALKPGDIVKAPDQSPGAGFAPRRLPRRHVPRYGHEHEVRVVLGPQESAFTKRGIETFLSSQYTVTGQSDRMGYRLEGPEIEHFRGPDIVSDGIALGSVQVPGSGQPIILLADRGVTGGYTKIATVVSADISRLAQAMPGDKVRFKAITVEEAHAILRQREEVLGSITESPEDASGRLSIVVGDEAFEVVDESGALIALAELVDDGSRSWSRHARATIGSHTYEFEVRVHQLD